MENPNQYIPFETDNDMIQSWLDHSIQTINHFPKPSVDKFTAKFVLYTCDMLELEKDVFFMTIDLIGKYDCSRFPSEDPILTILILLYISNKLVGERGSLSILTLCIYLQKTEYKTVTKSVMEHLEITIMKRLQYELPISSTMDELNVLIEVLIKPEAFMVLFRKQCLSVLNIVYLHTKTVTDVLDEIYAKSEGTKIILETLYENKLYIPAGVLLCAVMMSKGTNFVKLNEISNNISNFTKIHNQDLDLLAQIIYNVVNRFVQNTK